MSISSRMGHRPSTRVTREYYNSLEGNQLREVKRMDREVNERAKRNRKAKPIVVKKPSSPEFHNSIVFEDDGKSRKRKKKQK